MQRKNFFGGGQFMPSLGRKVPLRRSFLGVPQGLPPTCGPNEHLVVKVENLQEKWVCEPLAAGAPNQNPPPAGNPPAPAPAPACNVPPGYEPLPGGGVSAGHAVWACPVGDGTYNLLNPDDFTVILAGVSKECVDLFGDVTMKATGECDHSATPTTGACALPKGSMFIMCPPSNGVTVNYYLDARTGSYGPNMTTQSPECESEGNVIKVGANSPYCGGSEVSGPGNDFPSLVACHYMPGNSFEENLVVLHNGSDMAVLEDRIMLKDIPTKYPGRRWIYITDAHCSELPDFGVPAAAPAPAPAPVPAPAPAPQPPIQTTPLPAPPPAPAPVPLPAPPPPEPGRILVIMPPPMAQPSPCDAGAWLRQRPAPPPAASPALGTPRRIPLRRGPFGSIL